MLHIVPHPIRKNAFSVLSRTYRVGLIAEGDEYRGGWCWLLNPDGLPISLIGEIDSKHGAERALADSWNEALLALGLETGEPTLRAELELEHIVGDNFWLARNGRQVGDILVIRAGQAGVKQDVYRWSVGDHPVERNRLGFADDLTSARAAAEAGWQEWLRWVGVRHR